MKSVTLTDIEVSSLVEFKSVGATITDFELSGAKLEAHLFKMNGDRITIKTMSISSVDITLVAPHTDLISSSFQTKFEGSHLKMKDFKITDLNDITSQEGDNVPVS